MDHIDTCIVGAGVVGLAIGRHVNQTKITRPGDPPADFVIHGENIHGIEGLVQLFGIESPGLTSSMAIADYVADLLLA